MAKIAFISHGHPDISKGGAEVASWNLCQLLKEHGHDCFYIARVPDDSKDDVITHYKAKEVLFSTRMHNWFNLSTENIQHLAEDMVDVLNAFDPEIIHIHHYAHIGMEMFPILRRTFPASKIVFTIHEFMAICLHNGQMVKKRTFDLCNKSEFSECHTCFPQYLPGDFFLRKQYILDQFANIDAFISPSAFLARRYEDWGISKEKMHVIENVLPEYEKLLPRLVDENGKRGRLAFFGQINPYKGIDVLLNAINELPENIKRHIHVDIHGANLDVQDSEFKEKVKNLLDSVGSLATMHGRYEAHELKERIAACDWVIIPSIWWENSPVVIQEAISFGRPLIGSNIGGMKEKIAGKAGLTFENRDPKSLANCIVEAIEPETFDYWHKKLSEDSFSAASDHLDFIEKCIKS